MAINVTPIPRLTVLTVPAFTLGTANAAGSAVTAIASDSTLLVYDATVPTTIASAASAATGSATTSARRDHTHGMFTAVGTATQSEMEAASSTTTSASPGRTQYHPGVAKWTCQITGAGLLRTPSYNVASITDSGTGNRDIVFDTDYSSTVFECGGCDSEGNSAYRFLTYSAFATGSVKFRIFDADNNVVDMASSNYGWGDQ